MVVASVGLIEIRDKFNALTEDEEEDNEDQDPSHVRLFPAALCWPREGLGGVLGGDDQAGVEYGEDDVGTQFYKHKLHPEHVDCNVGGILNRRIILKVSK